MDDLIQFISTKATQKIDIDASTQLRELGISSSLALWRLLAALERKYKVTIESLNGDMDVTEISRIVGLNDGVTASQNTKSLHQKPGETPAENTSASASSHIHPVTGMPSIGVDIEEVASLPVVNSLRDDEFYQRIFTESELAQAILKPDQYAHLCGVFCAKEALRKAHPDILELDMKSIEIRSSSGAPIVEFKSNDIAKRLFCQISISHTSSYATAVALVVQK